MTDDWKIPKSGNLRSGQKKKSMVPKKNTEIFKIDLQPFFGGRKKMKKTHSHPPNPRAGWTLEETGLSSLCRHEAGEIQFPEQKLWKILKSFVFAERSWVLFGAQSFPPWKVGETWFFGWKIPKVQTIGETMPWRCAFHASKVVSSAWICLMFGVFVRFSLFQAGFLGILLGILGWSFGKQLFNHLEGTRPWTCQLGTVGPVFDRRLYWMLVGCMLYSRYTVYMYIHNFGACVSKPLSGQKLRKLLDLLAGFSHISVSLSSCLLSVPTIKLPSITLPETNTSHPKIGFAKKETSSSSNHPFSGANLLLVSGRVIYWSEKLIILEA